MRSSVKVTKARCINRLRDYRESEAVGKKQ